MLECLKKKKNYAVVLVFDMNLNILGENAHGFASTMKIFNLKTVYAIYMTVR